MPNCAAAHREALSPYRGRASFAAVLRNPPDRESAHRRRYRWPSRTCARCRQVRTIESAVSCRPPHHKTHAATIGDFLVALIEAAVFERDDPLRRARLAFTHGQDHRLRPQGVAGKDRLWEL